MYRYTLPLDQTEWKFDGHTAVRVQEAFAAMGAIEFAQTDAAAMLDNDSRVADEFDAMTRLRDAGAA